MKASVIIPTLVLGVAIAACSDGRQDYSRSQPAAPTQKAMEPQGGSLARDNSTNQIEGLNGTTTKKDDAIKNSAPGNVMSEGGFNGTKVN